MIDKKFNINLSNLSVGYSTDNVKKKKVILENLNFKATAGEMIALIGQNGAGKSTLLRTLAGFQPYLLGSIQINDKVLSSFKPKEIAQVISFVSTENLASVNMTVFDLVAYGRFPYTGWIGKLTKDDKDIINYSIEKVGIPQLADRMVAEISDGERQRALIARALAQDTPIILLDEPTAYLDVSNKYEIFHLLQTLAADKNKTIIMSTHDLNIALREVDKIWMVTENGYFEGAPEDAVIDGKLNSLFNNSKIEFDLKEGTYFFKKQFKTKVQVIGEGINFRWTLRALNRKGYQITEQPTDFVVKVTDNKWLVNKNNNIKKYNSIYELLKEQD